jgi:hypothetical protein
MEKNGHNWCVKSVKKLSNFINAINATGRKINRVLSCSAHIAIIPFITGRNRKMSPFTNAATRSVQLESKT